MSALRSSPGSRPGGALRRGNSRLSIAHRGASGPAPEHTIEAYSLAIEQGADFIEPDLQITRDGVLICLHDLTLERTTDVRQVFPDRFRDEAGSERHGQGATRENPESRERHEQGETRENRETRERRWYASDFTLAEIRRLDAGSWFGPRFRGARIPTFAEAIDLALGSAGIFPETKAPEVYGALGFSMERLLVEELRRHALDRRDANPATPVVIQSFSRASLEILEIDLGVDLETVFLVEAPDESGWLEREGLARVARIADGIGPAKELLLKNPETVRWAHEVGLTVFPWTFRAVAPGAFENVAAEMSHYLYNLGVDGLFTNDPDRFPRRPS